MPDNLHYNTVTPQLRRMLGKLMEAHVFDSFRLVGGTSLSLQRGHRKSVDIDLFTDVPYGSIDFEEINQYLRSNYKYVDTNNYQGSPGIGKSYYVGDNRAHNIKLDIYYTDDFIRPAKIIDGIKLATEEEIIAMKLDVISRVGRKKDFWDIHELMDDYPFDTMLSLHEERYPYAHDKALIKKNFSMFDSADEDFEPVCLRQKHWQVIKLDMLDFVR